MAAATVNNPYTWGTGRRKTAVARVRVREGTGKFVVNKIDVDEYFVEETHRSDVRSPLRPRGIQVTEGEFRV